MNIFNIITGSASIISLIICIFTATQVVKIKNIISYKNDNSSTKSKILTKGNENKTAGRDIHE